MSSVYVSEPPTKGKVILNTTYGPMDIELWPKEAPKAVRNFVQLCMEGYYENTIFHRIIKSFLVQGGDPTGTGEGGESIYGSVFADEFHSRLRFNHRGIVACANAGPPHSNGSQFFITLDRCDWLDRKHTIFGKVTGDSIYNLIRLGEVETDKNDRPLDPLPKITSVENSSEVKATRDAQLSVRETLGSKREELKESEAEFPESLDYSDDEASFDARMRLQILKRRKELGDLPTKEKLHNESSSVKEHERSPPRSDAENFDDQPKVEKLYLKKKGIGSEARAERMVKADADLQLLGEAEREKQLQKQKRRRRQGHEDEVLAKLEKFKKAIAVEPVESNSKVKGGNNEDLSDWTGVELKFTPQPGKDNMSQE
ncbi:Peptidyl-prolyl cis-trans isomerase CYP57 [Camellia lanceoleosa]|uniref:Peptidyl-prolyl cis-trans isomerase CYP57 n=1 Tax=Camellia lanceoleosa TaxID=1840588 RepID=A0ACC0FJJ1_9ERIC|nr:Peptidyl-prolyl cis-trans isomerase CYP57 [Camellia lanceoleosa]